MQNLTAANSYAYQNHLTIILSMAWASEVIVEGFLMQDLKIVERLQEEKLKVWFDFSLLQYPESIQIPLTASSDCQS